MELPPKHSRLFGYMDARGCGVDLTQTFQTLWIYGCQGLGDASTQTGMGKLAKSQVLMSKQLT